MKIEHPFIVWDADEHGILGINVMDQAKAVLDVSRQRVFIGNKSVWWFEKKGKPLFSKVVASKTVHVPPGREILFPGRVCNLRNFSLEPAFCIFRKTGALIARVAVDLPTPTVPIRIFNPCDESITIYQNSTMGILQPIDQYKQFEEQKEKEQINSAGCEEKSQKTDNLPEHLVELYSRSIKNLNENEQIKLKSLLKEYSDVFARDSNDIGHTNVVQHHIDTGDESPIKQRPRRLPMVHLEVLKKQIEDLKNRNIIRESSSNWASNVILVKKKDSTWRLCVDYMGLNAKTKNRDPYLLPRIDDTLDALAHAQYFCTLDLIQGYHQVELTEELKPKTAFVTPKLTPNHWEYNYMPFGVQGGPSTFQRLMDKIFRGLEYKIALAY